MQFAIYIFLITIFNQLLNFNTTYKQHITILLSFFIFSNKLLDQFLLLCQYLHHILSACQQLSSQHVTITVANLNSLLVSSCCFITLRSFSNSLLTWFSGGASHLSNCSVYVSAMSMYCKINKVSYHGGF